MTMNLAFSYALPVSRSSTFASHSVAPPRRPRQTTLSTPRRLRVTSLLKPNAEPPLLSRSVITLRVLSDLSLLTLLHELSQRLITNIGPTGAFQHDTELLLGGLLGVWTGACLLQRLAFDTSKMVRSTRELPDLWDRDTLYRPTVSDEEMADIVTWLCAFNEVSGRGYAMVKSGTTSENVAVRRGVAERLARYGETSNVVNGMLGSLCEDEDEKVQHIARTAMEEMRERHLASIGNKVVDNFLGDMGRSMSRYEPLHTQQWDNKGAIDVLSKRVEVIGQLALTPRSDIRASLEGRRRERGWGKVKVPLFEGMAWSEIHGICALALIPMAYELHSIGGAEDLPLRFVGLGWILTLGGLVAYPASAQLASGLGSVVRAFMPSLKMGERAA